MPPAFLVSACLISAALALSISPMPKYIRWLISGAFAVVGAVYFFDSLNLLDMAQKAISLRLALIGLSAVIIISIAAWRVGGAKVWRR